MTETTTQNQVIAMAQQEPQEMVRRTRLGLVLSRPNGLMAAASNCLLLRLVGMSVQLPPAADEKQLPMLRAASGSGNFSRDVD